MTLLAAVSACSGSAGEHVDESDVARAELAAKADLWAGHCELPFRFTPDPDAEDRARDRLAIVAPAATLSWSPTRGTLATVTNLNLPIGDCDGDLGALIADLLESEPDIFQLDTSEWKSWPLLSCAAPPIDQWISGYRTQIAGHDAQGDVLGFRLKQTAAGIVLDAISATYLPSEIPGLEQRLDACPELSKEQAHALAFAASLPYSTFDYCTPTGSGRYQPAPGDALELGKPFVGWGQANAFAPVDLFLRTPATLTVSPKHHTPELLQSSAYCPPTVGFRLTFEPTQPSLLESSAGIDCVVCLAQ